MDGKKTANKQQQILGQKLIIKLYLEGHPRSHFMLH